jgi:hypothetical protein
MSGADADVAAIAANLARSRSWPVFPCRDDKRPTCPHGFKDAVSEPGAVADLWRRYPGSLVGVATGALSGVFVLDIDLKHAPALHWWQVNEPSLPPTRAFRTRSGGIHLYFTHAPGLGCSAGKLAEGVDTRSDGGYVVAWFAAGLECLDHTPPARLPPWIVAALLPKPDALRSGAPRDYGDRAIDGALRAITAAPEGKRNAVLHWAACRLGERVRAAQIGAGEAEALLVDAAAAAGLSQREARATARSGLGRTL